MYQLGAGVISVESTEGPQGKNKEWETHQTPCVRIGLCIWQ